MALPSVFDLKIAQNLLDRLEKLTPDMQPKWGKMDVSKMLAHTNVTYDLAYERIPNHVPFLMKFILKLLVKGKVTNEVPYKNNERTSPIFIITDDRNFEKEKAILINNINETQQKGKSFFDGRVNTTFGALTAEEWNNMIYKHLDHHFRQFGV